MLSTVLECIGVLSSVPEGIGVCFSMFECICVCLLSFECVRVLPSVPEHAQVYLNVAACVGVRRRLPEFSRMLPSCSVSVLPRKHDYSRLRVSGFAQSSFELYSLRVMLRRSFRLQFSRAEKKQVLCSSSSDYASAGVLSAEGKLARASLPSIYCVRSRRRFAISCKHGRTRQHCKHSGTLETTCKQSATLPHTRTH